MAAIIAGKKISVKEFSTMDLDENSYYELINGLIVKKQAPSFAHQNSSMNLSIFLGNFNREKKLGKLVASPIDVFFDDYNNTQPDLLFIKKEREYIITNHGIEGAPDLIVEILSPSTFRYDRREKFNLYMQFGVSEYWIVEPVNKSIEVYVLENGKYDLQFSAISEGIIQSNVLAGLNLDIAAVFE